MSRYTIRRPIKALWVDDCVHVSSQSHVPDVPDHEATPTGLLDKDGNEIWRQPRAIGFGRRGEW